MSAKVHSVGGAFDCDPQACCLDVIYLDIICTYMLYTLLAISYDTHSLLWAKHLIVTHRLAT